jgi:hypothetical protein
VKRRFTTSRFRQLVECSYEECVVPVDADAAEECIEVRARNVTAKRDARAMRALITAAFAACIPRRRTNENRIDAMPRSVATAPHERSCRAVLRAARLHQPLVALTVDVVGVSTQEDSAETLFL